MRKLLRTFLCCLCLYAALWPKTTWAQRPDQQQLIAGRLETLAGVLPGLDEKVNLSVSGTSIQEFLRALAEAADLNINVDPNLDMRIYNNFQSETARNILLFLATEYQLDLSVIGTIISVNRLDPSKTPKEPKPVQIQYSAETDRVSMELQNDTLSRVAKALTERSGKNVVVTNEAAGTLVNLFVQDLDFATALRQLAFNNRLKLSETAAGAFILMPLGNQEENFINEQAELSTRRQPMQSSADGKANGLYVDVKTGGARPLLTIDAVNTPIEQIIKNAAEQVNASYFITGGMQGTVTTRLRDVPFGDVLSALLRGTEYTYKLENGIYTIGQRKAEGLRDIRVVKLQQRSIDTVQSMIPAEWKAGVEIKEFREQNTLLLAGAAPQINEIANLIKELDTRVPMVLIEVTMLDIRKGHKIETGIKAGISDSIVTGGTLLSGLDFTFGAGAINTFLKRIGTGGSFNLGRVSPNFYVHLSALEQNHNVEMRSVPKLSTLNGHAAKLSIGNKRYYSISTQNVLGSFNPQTVVTQQYNEVEANMSIDIVPIVSGDEQVTLKIGVDITDFTQDTPLDQPPPSTTSKFESIIRVGNEETVVLGGIERYESSSGGSGIPILSKIPLLKWLFSSRNNTRNKVISVVFIKPTIMYQ